MRHLCLWEGQVDILFNSQPATIGQPTSHVKKCQPVRLWLGQIVGGRRTGGPTTLGPHSGSEPSHWFPLGEWPTWPRRGKWHKWDLQSLIYHWHYLQGTFAVLYQCDLITYSCTKHRTILSRLFSVQTNLLISFPHQFWCITTQRYHFLGTTFIIINRKCYGKKTLLVV